MSSLDCELQSWSWPCRCALYLSPGGVVFSLINPLVRVFAIILLVTEDEVKEHIAKAKGQARAKSLDMLSVDQIAHLLIEALDRDGVRHVELFLRSAGKADVKALSVRLQEALNVTTSPPANMLPQNSLA